MYVTPFLYTSSLQMTSTLQIEIILLSLAAHILYNIRFSTVHLFPIKIHIYYRYTFENEEETSIKAQGRWHDGHPVMEYNIH